jgi:hypothetical protein
MVPDSAVFVSARHPAARSASGAGHDLPLLARSTAALANRHNSRLDGAALYVIGGIDSSGRARATVYLAPVVADTAVGQFTAIEPLPAPVAGAIAMVRRGRIYVLGGADALGRPQSSVYVGRVGINGHIDGWYVQPALPSPRAHGGRWCSTARRRLRWHRR